METLANDILVHIFSFLPTSSLAQLATLSTRFRSPLSSPVLWRAVCLRHGPPFFDWSASFLHSDPPLRLRSALDRFAPLTWVRDVVPAIAAAAAEPPLSWKQKWVAYSRGELVCVAQVRKQPYRGGPHSAHDALVSVAPASFFLGQRNFSNRENSKNNQPGAPAVHKPIGDQLFLCRYFRGPRASAEEVDEVVAGRSLRQVPPDVRGHNPGRMWPAAGDPLTLRGALEVGNAVEVQWKSYDGARLVYGWWRGVVREVRNGGEAEEVGVQFKVFGGLLQTVREGGECDILGDGVVG
eukprot:CAMPEP_0174913290 /NCGR_PEP_ID=MMETSP0167-20121228/80242_1 /TAXON_ID=38298 /ORGANISM="Rhodella maculata, Strain CCMP736" /LENGTH=294 /DNA_ID=CAMNT_0016158005 /DNA_START=499 /DNA_END=1379 /DNA_ORIENTATION=-